MNGFWAGTMRYEKNAIRSAWLMRRIGASGSLVGARCCSKMPLASSVEPSEGCTTGSGAGAGWNAG